MCFLGEAYRPVMTTSADRTSQLSDDSSTTSRIRLQCETPASGCWDRRLVLYNADTLSPRRNVLRAHRAVSKERKMQGMR